MTRQLPGNGSPPVVGILGGGQLSRMLSWAAVPLDISCVVMAPENELPARRTAEILQADYSDQKALETLAQRVSVVTYEFENLPYQSLQWLSERVPVYPPPDALRIAQDRVLEKDLFRTLGIATADYRAVDDEAAFTAPAPFSFPAILKTRRDGYDGKGQRRVKSWEEARAAFADFGNRPCILESLVAFQRELSLIGVAGVDGSLLCYPLTENVHRDGVLVQSIAPAKVSDTLTQTAVSYVRRLCQSLSYVGVLALELFEVEGSLFANEMAPRVHNSGHWTIEGSTCSQFENHIRAVTGLPLGDVTSPWGHAGMVNLLGMIPSKAQMLAKSGVHLHLYQKSPKPGRKLGHLTVVAKTRMERDDKIHKLTGLTDASLDPSFHDQKV